MGKIKLLFMDNVSGLRNAADRGECVSGILVTGGRVCKGPSGRGQGIRGSSCSGVQGLRVSNQFHEGCTMRTEPPHNPKSYWHWFMAQECVILRIP